MPVFRIKIGLVVSMSLCCIAVSVPFDSSLAAQSYQSDASSTNSEEKLWEEDLDAKIDTTIKMLKVIQEEVRVEEKDKVQKEGSAEEGEDDAWGDTIRKVIRRTARIWKKVKEIKKDTADETEGTLQAQDRAATKKELREQLNKSIKAMSIIKEELERLDESEKTAEDR